MITKGDKRTTILIAGAVLNGACKAPNQRARKNIPPDNHGAALIMLNKIVKRIRNVFKVKQRIESNSRISTD